ncbi:MAG: type II toxin-antitoxin system VapC family toxin [Chitinophagales bacterium]|nr:type II toxin-antitoxin system VapC family toxin [Chitinophagales bacterium]
MIILDTNVLSALMKSEPDPVILQWCNGYDLECLWLTAITVMEVQYGIGLLSDGKKKRMLQESFNRMLRQQFRHRIIAFDYNAGMAAGELAAENQKTGMNQDIRDYQIAAIALVTGAVLATRNERDFKQTGVTIINPWSDQLANPCH